MDKYDKKTLDFIRKYEGFREDAYQVPGEDFYTIGIGATEYENGSPIGSNDRITRERAEELLKYHVDRSIEKVSKLEGFQALPYNAEVAVRSFAYNHGPNFIDDDKNFGSINEAIRAGDYKKIAEVMPLYTTGGMPGLIKRRDDEAKLALTPAMDPVDSTLANDSTRKFGTPAVLDGKDVRWGGKDYKWQSPESFATITPPAPPAPEDEPGFYNLFGLLK